MTNEEIAQAFVDEINKNFTYIGEDGKEKHMLIATLIKKDDRELDRSKTNDEVF